MIAGILAALASCVLWGFTFLGPKAVQPVGVLDLVVGRYLVFATCSLIMLAVKRSEVKSITGRQVLMAVHLGVVGYLGFYAFIAASVTVGGGIIAPLVTGTIPMAVAVVWNIRKQETPWREVLFPMTLTTVGLIALQAGEASSADDLRGRYRVMGALVLALLGCAAWVYFVVVNASVQRRPTFRLDNTVWTALIGLGAGLGCLFLIPVAAVTGDVHVLLTATVGLRFVGWCILLGFVGSWCATWLWTWASKRLPTTLAAQLIAVEALCGAAFSLAWEGKLPTWYETGAGALVILGVVLCIATFNAHRQLS